MPNIRFKKRLKGNGIMLYGIVIMIVMITMLLGVTQLFYSRLNAMELQTAIDSVSDGTAVKMALDGGEYQDAVSHAEKLSEDIGTYTGVSLGEIHLDEARFDDDEISVSSKTEVMSFLKKDDSENAGIYNNYATTKFYRSVLGTDVDMRNLTENVDYYIPQHGTVRMVRFPQGSPARWAVAMYGSLGAYAYNACGPTSLAMVTTYLSGQLYTPLDVGNWCVEHGYVNGSGTSGRAISSFIRSVFGSSVIIQEEGNQGSSPVVLSPTIRDFVVNKLNDGFVIIVNRRGHYYVVREYVDDPVMGECLYVNDPGGAGDSNFDILIPVDIALTYSNNTPVRKAWAIKVVQ